MPKFNSLNDPAFAPIKAQLARCYLRRKADLDVPDVDDANIVARVDDITRTLLARMGRALNERDAVWLRRFAWFCDLINGMMDDLPDKLDA